MCVDTYGDFNNVISCQNRFFDQQILPVITLNSKSMYFVLHVLQVLMTESREKYLLVTNFNEMFSLVHSNADTNLLILSL